MDRITNHTDHSQHSPGLHAELFGTQPEQCVRVHTLGRFTVQVDDKPFPPKLAAQQKPMEFLQAIISLGGRNISSEIIGSSLWPDAEGDAAANAFDINLFRARKILGYKDAITVSAGKYSLNNARVWVDAWEFERILNKIDRILVNPANTDSMPGDIELLLQDALSLYQGGFLSRETAKPWNVSLRERLRFKLFRHITSVSHIAEENGRWTNAIHFYQKGLEIEPLAEELYQRLMICYQYMGRKAEALSVYQRCRANLSAGLDIAPSPETEKIRTSIYLAA